jgi:hypothetical protein
MYLPIILGTYLGRTRKSEDDTRAGASTRARAAAAAGAGSLVSKKGHRLSFARDAECPVLSAGEGRSAGQDERVPAPPRLRVVEAQADQ